MLPIPGRESLNGGSTPHLSANNYVVWLEGWPVSYRGTYSPIRRLLASEWMGIHLPDAFGALGPQLH
jgi:hypothetical protein